MENSHTASLGRAKTVLVARGGDREIAVLSWVLARAAPLPSGRVGHDQQDNVRVVGVVQFDEAVLARIQELLAPLANRILNSLRQASCRFELSVANVDAASSQDLNMIVSGFSADGAILLAMVAAGLEASVREDVVTTASIASPEGHAAAVGALGAKIAAAQNDPSVRRLVYASLDGDGSLSALAPNERDRSVRALVAARHSLETLAIADVGDLFPLVFDDFAVVLASLRQGYFADPDRPESDSGPVARVVRFLRADNVRRFSATLERCLFEGNNAAIRELLSAYVAHHVRSQAYPSTLGALLQQLLNVLPSTTRRHLITFPLVPLKQCLALGMLADPDECNDVLQLIDAASGRHLNEMEAAVHTAEVGDSLGADARARREVDRVLSLISHDTLCRKFDIPLDLARETYPLERITAKTHEDFSDQVCSFCLHLLRRSALAPIPADRVMLAAEATRLLNAAFAQEGGERAAEAESRNPTRGGMRMVCDRMTDRMKEETKYKYVDRILKEAVDPFDANQKVVFMRAVLDHVGDQLPSDVRSRPVEDFVEHRDHLIRSYVRSTDRLAESFRSVG